MRLAGLRQLCVCSFLAVFMAGCGGAQSVEDSERAGSEPSPQLPALGRSEAPDPYWSKLLDFDQRGRRATELCAAALYDAEQWWESLRSKAQELFVHKEAPDEETIRRWTVERRFFFEDYLSSASPILVMRDGQFQLSPQVSSVILSWTACAEDEESAARWRMR